MLLEIGSNVKTGVKFMGGWINTEGYICLEWEILVYLQTKNMRKYANRSEV